MYYVSVLFVTTLSSHACPSEVKAVSLTYTCGSNASIQLLKVFYLLIGSNLRVLHDGVLPKASQYNSAELCALHDCWRCYSTHRHTHTT